VDDKAIREINLLYLGEDRPTDVIAFDLGKGGSEIFADLAVSTDTAVRQARIYKTQPAYEIYLYVVHGILHIMGFDDKTAKKRRLMDEKTRQILSALKI